VSHLTPAPTSIAVTCRCRPERPYGAPWLDPAHSARARAAEAGHARSSAGPMLTSSHLSTECLVPPPRLLPPTSAESTRAFAPHPVARSTAARADRSMCDAFVRPATSHSHGPVSCSPPRFAPGLPTTARGRPYRDPDVSPDQAFPGWLSQFSGHVHVIGYSFCRRPRLMGTRWNDTVAECERSRNCPGVDHVIPQPVR